MQLTLPFKALTTQLHRVKTNSISAEYQKWRQRFLLERLHLAVAISLIVYPILVAIAMVLGLILRAADGQGQASLPEILLVLLGASARELCLLLCLTLLKIPQARRYPELLFSGFCWSLTLIGPIQSTLEGIQPTNPLPWLFGFPAIAMLVPVCWRLHLVSQLVVFFYCVGASRLLDLLGLVDGSKAALKLVVRNEALGAIAFWGLYIFLFSLICLICNLGVYLYERILRTEFEYRTQQQVFLHAVSHDLRNPVLGTAMVLKNLLNQSGEKVRISRSMLERMVESSDHQLDLINSLLEAHNAEVKGFVLHCQPLNLSPLIQSAIADLQPMLDKEQTLVTNLIPADLPPVNTDPLQLSRVYQNLIVNAIKYNRPGLSITLDAKLEGGWVRCTVADNGVGMRKEQCEKLFDLYFRGEQKRQSVSLGLGLYLCRQIITAHGGEIGVYSRPGEGATFWFTFPLAVLKIG